MGKQAVNNIGCLGYFLKLFEEHFTRSTGATKDQKIVT